MNIDKIVEETHKNMSMNKINDKLYLSNNQIDILNRYNIEYKTKSIEELLFDLEEILNDTPDYDDLENLSSELAEFNYYYNTNK